MSKRTHTQTIGMIYEAFGRGDVPAILEHVADAVDWDNTGVASRECPWNGDFSGKKHLPGFFEALAATLDFTKFEPRSFIEQGAQLAVHLRIESKVRKNGRVLANDCVHLWTFDAQGRVARYRHFNDTAAELAAWRD